MNAFANLFSPKAGPKLKSRIGWDVEHRASVSRTQLAQRKQELAQARELLDRAEREDVRERGLGRPGGMISIQAALEGVARAESAVRVQVQVVEELEKALAQFPRPSDQELLELEQRAEQTLALILEHGTLLERAIAAFDAVIADAQRLVGGSHPLGIRVDMGATHLDRVRQALDGFRKNPRIESGSWRC